MPLVTVANYNTATGQSLASAQGDELILMAESLLSQFLGVQNVNSTVYTDQVQTSIYGGMLNLRSAPVVAGESFVVKLRNDGNNTTTLPSDAYRVENDRGIVHYLGSRAGTFVERNPFSHQLTYSGRYPSWPKEYGSVLVTYTAGWTSATVPQNVKSAIYSIVSRLRSLGDDTTIVSESVGGYTYTRAQTDNDLKNMLSSLVGPLQRGLA